MLSRRMHRLFGKSGRLLIVAMDHAAVMDRRVTGLERYADTVRVAVEAGADAFLAPIGSLRQHAGAFGRSAVIASVEAKKPSVRDAVESALIAGADAVKCMIYPFSGDHTVSSARHLIAIANRWGLPIIAEAIPGGFERTDLHNPETIAAAARVCAEMGADCIKTFYTGDPETMKAVVAYANVPVVVLGGGRKDSPRALFEEVYGAVVVAGCAGAAIGRNIWQSDDPAAVVRGLCAIIHQGATPEAALAIAGHTAT